MVLPDSFLVVKGKKTKLISCVLSPVTKLVPVEILANFISNNMVRGKFKIYYDLPFPPTYQNEVKQLLEMQGIRVLVDFERYEPDDYDYYYDNSGDESS